MGSIAVGERNKMLNAITGRATYTASAGFYVQLHVGDPGADGTGNIAGETDRTAVTFGTDAATGAISNTADVTWTNLNSTETLTHVSFWTASTSGTFLGSDDLPTSKDVNSGDTFTIPTGDLDLTIT